MTPNGVVLDLYDQYIRKRGGGKCLNLIWLQYCIIERLWCLLICQSGITNINRLLQRYQEFSYSRLYILSQKFQNTNLHFVLLFWNHVLTWASVIFKPLANADLSAEAKYFCLWNRFSSSIICNLEKEVLGFFLFGGVLFW